MLKISKTLLRMGLLLSVPAMACSSIGLTPPSTPTPTGTVIFAQENQTPGAPTDEPVDPRASCLKAAGGTVNVGKPCVRGRYDMRYDILQKPNDHETIDTKSLLHGDISLWAVRAGQVEGGAHLSYSLDSHGVDQNGDCGHTFTEIVPLFSWDVKLKGQYFSQPDGSTQLIVQAIPARGPDYVELLTADCPIENRPQSGINWAGAGGALVNGVFHAVNQIPIPSDATGTYFTDIWLGVQK
jgi:hypothetical protein